MNAVERRDWLKAVSESLPRWRLGALNKLLAGLDVDAPGGFWEGGMCGRSGDRVLALRYFGGPGDFARWRLAAGRLLDLPGAGEAEPPTDGFPWVTLVWNGATGGLVRAVLLSRVPGARGAGASAHWSLTRAAGRKKPETSLLNPDRYSPRTIGDARLAKALDEFGAHCPIRDVVYQFSIAPSGKRRPLPAWSLRLKDPVAWPRFLRLDLASSFTAESTLLSFLLLDRRVSELAFEGETLWAFFRG
jgi:hypothetical protein